MKICKFMFLGLIILFLAGCYVTPYGVYNLRVADKEAETLWLNGKELLKLANEDAEVIVNYDTSQSGMLLFDVSILNKSKDMLLISPEKFSCNTVNRLDDQIKLNAINPEIMINSYSKSIERINADQSGDERSSLLFSMFEVADNFTDKTDEERKEARKEQRDRQESEAIRTNNNNYNLKKMEKLRESFELKSLRKTSLMPGQKLSGRVYFKVKGSIKEFSLNIPIKDEEFNVKYMVEKI